MKFSYLILLFWAAATATAAADTQALVKDALQLESRETRAAAIAGIRKGLGDADASAREAHLAAFMKILDVEFDKKAFRPLILPFLQAKDGNVAAQGCYALNACGKEPGDLKLILDLAKNPPAGLRDRLSHLLFTFTDGDLTGEAGDAVVKLLNDGGDYRGPLRGLWGAKFSPELEARVIALSKNADGTTNHDANYFALSTQANKSERSIKRLIEILADPDIINISGRAAWGLQQGVAKEQQPLVAGAALNVVEARADGYLRKNALRLIAAYADASNMEAIDALLAKPNISPEVKSALEAAKTRIGAAK
jgi:hypothetical protein